MARTIIDVDPELLAMAKDELGVKTNNAAVTEALRRVVRQRALGELIEDLSTMDEESREALGRVRERNW